jgi:hypothetical protein
VLKEGQAAALEPRSRRPRSSPNRITEDIKKQAIGVRAALEQSGLDHGPISVHEKMRDLGMTPVPSTAALARNGPHSREFPASGPFSQVVAGVV